MPSPAEVLSAATKLQGYLLRRHWNAGRLVGPDTGIRFNYRIGRFVKSYLRFLPWHDDLYYLQAQGYWILSNWRLLDLGASSECGELARRCAAATLAAQRADGAWDYPNPEWRGRVTTYEGVWASLGLLETYRRTRDPDLVDGAIKWYGFMTREIGFKPFEGAISANYFAGRSSSAVPNATTDVLRFLAELASVTGVSQYLTQCHGLLRFLKIVQKPTGELPYEVSTEANRARLPHFQCFQYNAFECLGLMRYLQVTGDERARPLISGILSFLTSGVAAEGYARYACGTGRRRVTYHTAALAACFAEGTRMGFTGFEQPGERAYRWVVSRQRPDGSFPHSANDYGFVGDARSYPRNLAMILYHLLAAADGPAERSAPTRIS